MCNTVSRAAQRFFEGTILRTFSAGWPRKFKKFAKKMVVKNYRKHLHGFIWTLHLKCAFVLYLASIIFFSILMWYFRIEKDTGAPYYCVASTGMFPVIANLKNKWDVLSKFFCMLATFCILRTEPSVKGNKADVNLFQLHIKFWKSNFTYWFSGIRVKAEDEYGKMRHSCKWYQM